MCSIGNQKVYELIDKEMLQDQINSFSVICGVEFIFVPKNGDDPICWKDSPWLHKDKTAAWFEQRDRQHHANSVRNPTQPNEGVSLMTDVTYPVLMQTVESIHVAGEEIGDLKIRAYRTSRFSPEDAYHELKDSGSQLDIFRFKE